MHLPVWISAVVVQLQGLFVYKSDVQDDMNGEKEQQEGVVRGASTSPGQLEEATSHAELTKEVKSERLVAMSLLTVPAAAIISAKGTSFVMKRQGFCFHASIAMWFISLLIYLAVIFLTTFKEKSPPGLVNYAKIYFFSICITVIGIVFWYFA